MNKLSKSERHKRIGSDPNQAKPRSSSHRQLIKKDSSRLERATDEEDDDSVTKVKRPTSDPSFLSKAEKGSRGKEIASSDPKDKTVIHTGLSKSSQRGKEKEKDKQKAKDRDEKANDELKSEHEKKNDEKEISKKSGESLTRKSSSRSSGEVSGERASKGDELR